MNKAYEKLMLIQQELKAPKNNFHKFGNYNYRSTEDILEALKPLLAKNKATLNISDQIEYVGERYYIKATATLYCIECEAFIQSSAYAREAEEQKGMLPAQVTGSTSSYARKYALNGLFSIDDVKDDDTHNKHEDKQPSEAQRKRLFAIAKAKGISDEQIKKDLEHLGYTSSKDLTLTDYNKLIKGYGG